MTTERTAPALSNSPLNLAAIREFSRRELIGLLSAISGKKVRAHRKLGKKQDLSCDAWSPFTLFTNFRFW